MSLGDPKLPKAIEWANGEWWDESPIRPGDPNYPYVLALALQESEAKVEEIEEALERSREWSDAHRHAVLEADQIIRRQNRRLKKLEGALRDIWDVRRNGKSDFGKLLEILKIVQDHLPPSRAGEGQKEEGG